MENQKLKDELNSINFYECPDIKAGDILHYFFPENGGFKQTVKAFIKCAYYAVFSFCEFRQVGTPKTLTLCSNSYRSRADHMKAFDNVAGLIDNQLIVTPSKRKLNLTHLKDLFLPFVWTCQMKNTSASLSERFAMATGHFLRAYYDYSDVEKYIRKNKLDIKYLVTYCDVMPIDYYFTRRFSQKGLITVTLQHGTFITSSNSWAYLGSKSDYFLAESQAVVDSAKEIGYKGNMIAVGSPHTIGSQTVSEPEAFRTETLGIFMNTDMLPAEENIGMIKAVQDYCKAHGKKLLLKYHPVNNRNTYSKIIDADFVTAYGREISAEQFGDMIDVAIISSSTVFNTMLMKWKPVLLYVREGYDIGQFSGTEDIKFTNEEQLAEKISLIDSQKYKQLMEKYRSYFLCSGKYEDNYRNAFKKIGIL